MCRKRDFYEMYNIYLAIIEKKIEFENWNFQQISTIFFYKPNYSFEKVCHF